MTRRRRNIPDFDALLGDLVDDLVWSTAATTADEAQARGLPADLAWRLADGAVAGLLNHLQAVDPEDLIGKARRART
jgi:hypothetical protein